jgi:hypothetical protein
MQAWTIVPLILISVLPAFSSPPTITVRSHPGPGRVPSCTGSKLTTSRNSPCEPAADTPTPLAEGGLGACGESATSWHPPVVNGCRTGHEHGDAPPNWIADAGYSAEFNISLHENAIAHAAMKGFNAHLGDVDVYLRVHATSNALDRSERFHSYEVWARDPSGSVSHWQGWMNTGDPGADRVPRRAGFSTDVKPSILVVDERSWEQGIRCEQWYGATAPWSWDIAISLCNASTIYYYGEANESASMYWHPAPDGAMESDRRVDVSWFDFRNHPTGKFYATQFGEIVSGPKDSKCTETVMMYGVTYPNQCLAQYIAPSMVRVSFPVNTAQKAFDVTGVKLEGAQAPSLAANH